MVSVKSKIEQFGICGGTPAFQEPVHVGCPNIPHPEAFLDRVRDILDRRWLTNNGQYVQEFERRLCEYLGVKHCIPICNGTVALELAIRAAGLTGEIIVPSFTFIATCNAIRWQGLVPVFCDCDPITHLLDPKSVEKAITPKTTGILAVHLWGQACNPEEMVRLADKHGLTLLFDAAHAFGCSHNGVMVGNFGKAEVFSFHATKFFNTLEGGAVATNDDGFARSIRLMKNFGFVGYDNAEFVGVNGKMTEVSAAMGLTGMDELVTFIQRNRDNFELYRTELDAIPGIRFIEYVSRERMNYQYVVVDVDPATSPLNRDELLEVLWAENILARRYFYPGCHRMPAYVGYTGDVDLPGTDRASAGVLVLPTGTAVNRSGIQTICGVIKYALSHSNEIKAILKECERRISSTITI